MIDNVELRITVIRVYIKNDNNEWNYIQQEFDKQ